MVAFNRNSVSCRIRSVVSNAGSNHKQIYSNGACLSAKIAAPFSVSREEERGYKTVFQIRLVPPTVLMLLLHDLSSKSSHPICKVATWVESCSAAIRGAAAQRELVSSGAFGSVLTVEVKWEDAVLDCTSFGRSKTALICPRDMRAVLLQWLEEFGYQGRDVDCRDGGDGGGWGVSSQELVGGKGALLAVLPFCPCKLILHSPITLIYNMPELLSTQQSCFFSKLTAGPVGLMSKLCSF